MKGFCRARDIVNLRGNRVHFKPGSPFLLEYLIMDAGVWNNAFSSPFQLMIFRFSICNIQSQKKQNLKENNKWTENYESQKNLNKNTKLKLQISLKIDEHSSVNVLSRKWDLTEIRSNKKNPSNPIELRGNHRFFLLTCGRKILQPQTAVSSINFQSPRLKK